MVSDPEDWEEGGRTGNGNEVDEEEWAMSDHHLIWETYKVRVQRDAVRRIVDWDKLMGIAKELEEGEAGEEGRWYEGLLGESNYDKLIGLRAQCLKDSRHKHWWPISTYNIPTKDNSSRLPRPPVKPRTLTAQVNLRKHLRYPLRPRD